MAIRADGAGVSPLVVRREEVPRLALLVVDDEPLIRCAIAEAFSAAGHEVVDAWDGTTGLQAVARATRPFDVIFLDFHLPDSTDLALLATIRRRAPRSAVVLMTAFATADAVA